MDLPKQSDLKTFIPKGFLEINLGVSSVNVTVAQAKLRISDFCFNILAVNEEPLNELLGYVGFNYNGASFIKPETGIIELRMLKVDNKYFRQGIASHLLEYAHNIAKEMSLTMVLEPMRPGELTIKEFRDAHYPLTTDELREMYKRHGFREFSSQELEGFVNSECGYYLKSRLWFEGFNPISRKFGNRRYQMSPADADSLNVLSLSELEKELGKKIAPELITNNLTHCKNKVSRYLIANH